MGLAFAGVAADTASAARAAGNLGSRRTKIAAACTDRRSKARGKAWAAAYTVRADTARSTAARAGKEKDGAGRPLGSHRKTRSISLTNRISPRFRHAPGFSRYQYMRRAARRLKTRVKAAAKKRGLVAFPRLTKTAGRCIITIIAEISN